MALLIVLQDAKVRWICLLRISCEVKSAKCTLLYLLGMMRCTFGEMQGPQVLMDSVELVFDALAFQEQFSPSGLVDENVSASQLTSRQSASTSRSEPSAALALSTLAHTLGSGSGSASAK